MDYLGRDWYFLVAFGILDVPLLQLVWPMLSSEWKFIWSEYGYMILSATAKLFLGGMLDMVFLKDQLNK